MKTMWGNNVAEDIPSDTGKGNKEVQQNHNYLTTISVWQILKRARASQYTSVTAASSSHLNGMFLWACHYAIDA